MYRMSALFLILCGFFRLQGNAQTPPIQIDADFDSGNLRMAMRIAAGEYNIELEPYNDAAVWFHFRVLNAKDSTLTFHLLNGVEENIWYHLPPAFSHDWQHWDNILNHSYDGSTFTFTHTFTSDTTYIATHPAFNTRMMQEYLEQLSDNRKVIKKDTIAWSVQGRPIHHIVLTDPDFPDAEKLGAWMISRQHASELAGWFVLQGLLDWLLSDAPHAEAILQSMIFHIVPMMNPDGVYLGKYRTTSLNIDLNRQWDNADPSQEPSVYAVTRLVQQWVNGGNDFSLFFDFHATRAGQACFTYKASSSLIPGFISREYYNNQTAFTDLFSTYCPLIDGSRGFSTSTSTRLSRQYMIWKYGDRNPGFLALLYEGVNVPVNYGPYAGEPMTVELERQTGAGIGECIYYHYVQPLSVHQKADRLPTGATLMQVYPTPFRDHLYLKVNIPAETRVRISLFDLLGRKVAELLETPSYSHASGPILWRPNHLPSGIYFLVLATENQQLSYKIIHLD